MEENDSNRGGPEGAEHYSPPWVNGFDVCFSTEAKVPTWNPMIVPENEAMGVPKGAKPGEPYGTAYWTGPGTKAAENLEGDDSRIIMDRAVSFVQDASQRGAPFLAVIWYHAPHAPVVAGSPYKRLYPECSEGEQHYFGCITAMDEQVGRLRDELRVLGVANDTMLWFCSDNGPEGKRRDERTPGSAGPLRGRKRSLFEGGVRVPAVMEWPAMIGKPRVVTAPCCTSDYFPTVMDCIGDAPPGGRAPRDGVSLLTFIMGNADLRTVPIGFESGKQLALTGNRYKLISRDGGKTFQLFDLIEDPGETRDLAAERPETAAAMAATLEEWRSSCKKSREENGAGEDGAG
jgi:arylsulfatase A-like enzyme